MGAASCAIWKSLLKHEREGKDQELRGLNPARSPKPPNNFCHFCFLFAKSLGWAPTFLQNRKGEKYPFSETGCFVGSGTRMCSPVDLSPPGLLTHRLYICRLPGRAEALHPCSLPGWLCNTRGLSWGTQSGFPPQSQLPILSRLVRM